MVLECSDIVTECNMSKNTLLFTEVMKVTALTLEPGRERTEMLYFTSPFPEKSDVI